MSLDLYSSSVQVGIDCVPYILFCIYDAFALLTYKLHKTLLELFFHMVFYMLDNTQP